MGERNRQLSIRHATGTVPEPNQSIDIAWSPTESADLATVDLDWTLPDGEVVEQIPVVVDRGQRVVADLDICGPEETAGQTTGPDDKPGNGFGRVRS